MDKDKSGGMSPSPFVTTLLYLVAGALWIFFSSTLVGNLVSSPALQQRFELAKGLLFVVGSGGLIYFLLRGKAAVPRTIWRTGNVGRGYGIVGVILLLLLLVPTLGFMVVRHFIPQLELQVADNLLAISAQQVANIQNWGEERGRDVESIRNNPYFVSDIERLLTANGGSVAKPALARSLEGYRKAYDYRAVYFLTPGGEPVITAGEAPRALPAEIHRRINEFAATDRDSILTIAFQSEGAHAFSVDMLAPLHGGGSGNRLLGFLLLRSSPNQLLRGNLQNVPPLFNTLETALVHLEENGATAIDLQRPDQEIVPVGIREIELLRRFIGDEEGRGRVSYIDQIGSDAITVYHKLQRPGWFLVTRVERGEALMPVRRLVFVGSSLSFITLSAISGMLLLLWRQQRKNHELSLLASRAEHEHAMLEQEKVYRELFEANPNPMWVYDLRTLKFLDVNDAAMHHYGYSKEEFAAMTIADIRPPEDVSELVDQVAAKSAGGLDESGVWRHCTKDGNELLVDISSHRLVFKGREAALVLAYDITEQIRAQWRLVEAERFTRSTLDSLPMNIAVLDEDGDIIATNEQWRSFGTENGGALSTANLGANYLEACRAAAKNDGTATAMLRGLEEIFCQGRQRFYLEYPCHSPAEARWFAAHAVRFPQEAPLRVVVAHENITQRKLAEVELKKLNQYYAALSALNNVIIRARDPETMLRQVCELAVEHTGLEQVSVGRVEGNELVPGYVGHGSNPEFIRRGLTLENFRLDSGSGVTVQAVREGKSIVINDFFRDPRTTSWTNHRSFGPVKSLAACPIRRKNGVWGVMIFLARETDYFTPDLVELLQEMTDDVAYCLDMLEMEALRNRAETQLLLNAKIIESTHEGLFITGADNRITMVNQAMTDITGYSRSELIGRPPGILNSGQQSEDFYEELWRNLSGADRWEGEIWNRRKNGEVFPAWLSITRVHDPLNDGHHHIALYRDIAERKEYERRIEHLANHDVLTGLPNRFLLEEKTATAIALAKRHGHKLAMLFIDLDSFKLVNDTLGHDVGDELLRKTAERIVSVLRSSDTVCRVGGDEFVALTTELHKEHDAAVIAEKIIREVSQPFTIREHKLVVTASIGIALYPDHAGALEGLTRLADIAMINAKQSGHNRYRFYSDEMAGDSAEYLKMLNELRNAIPRGELYLVYQPQFDLRERRIMGVEALVRWHHPEYGQVSPDRFIPIAEDSGMIIEMGNWIMTEACRQAQAWRQRGMVGFPLSVNVSALQFRQLDFVDQVNRILGETALPGSCLELEVTESVLMTDLADVLGKLECLEQLGVKLAIDDFGTGYSSLSYLRQFSAHRIKIDKSFIQDLPDDKDAKAIAGAIVSMGNTLEMGIIAEGIETQVQADYLSAIGCRYGQGFLYARPMEADAFEALLSAQPSPV